LETISQRRGGVFGRLQGMRVRQSGKLAESAVGFSLPFPAMIRTMARRSFRRNPAALKLNHP
jgi:hypothetical protein